MLGACGGDKPAEPTTQTTQTQEAMTDTSADGMKTYRVATLFAFPPFAQDDAKGSAEGFDMDIINHIAETKGFKVTYHMQSWAGILEGLNTGKHDIVAAGVVVTPEREELYAFTDTYMDTGWMLVLKDQTADGKPNYSNFSEAVKGSTVFTTEYGAAGQDELEAIVQSHGNARMMDSSIP